ncbi:MAG: hypothetical protein U9R21_09190 [Candidatus Thermoplasmatota archaeon]|nr:hypothetical protein [Candidatus Thermoplasmatota archaeon]
MSKKITVTLDEDIINMLSDETMIDDVTINQAIYHYLQAGKQIANTSTSMETKMQLLENDKQKIEQEKNELEIEYTCLKQQKHQLESRISDLSELYPSASVLLGKKPVAHYSRIRLFKNKILKRK